MRISDWSSVVGSADLAAAFLEGAVWPDALDHHHVRLQAIEEGRADDERALPVAEPHALPVGDAEVGGGGRMDQQRRPLLALQRPRSLGEGGVEEGARERKSTRMNSSH